MGVSVATKKQKTDSFSQALELAASLNSMPLITHLLSHPLSTVTHSAITASTDTLIQKHLISVYIQQQDVDLEFKNNYLLQWTVENNQLDLLRSLIPKTDVAANDNYLIRKAAELGLLDFINILLPMSKIDPSSQNNYALRFAARNGHCEVLRLLLKDKRTDPTAEDNYAIRSAARNNHSKVVSLLLSDARVDPTSQTNHALRLAASNGHYETLKVLLEDNRVDPSAQQNYALRVSAEKGYVSIVTALLSNPSCDPSAVNNLAIRLASANGHLQVVKLLLNFPGVDPTDVNNHALRLASSNGHLEVVRELQKHSLANYNKNSTVLYDDNISSPTDIPENDSSMFHIDPPKITGSPSPLFESSYSGIDIYEMSVGSQCVMRRKTDNWINATHILKVAGMEKGKRTRVLERELHHQEHEKVQGGFGKYQGTW